MDSEESRRYWSKALYWGLECGADIVVFCVLGSWLWDREFSVTSFAPSMILAIVIMVGQRDFSRLFPKIGYGWLLLLGVVVGVSGSLIVDLYVSVYIKILHPEYFDMLVSHTQAMLGRMRPFYPEDTIQEAMAMTHKVVAPVLVATVTVFYAFASLIFSAFSALMVWLRIKNRKDSNDNK